MADKLKTHLKLKHLLAICGHNIASNKVKYSENIDDVTCGICKRMIDFHKMSKEDIFQAEFLRKKRKR